MEDNQTVRASSAPSSLANRLRPSNKRIRSAVTNGERAYVVGDGNSPWARRQRDLMAMHAEEAGGAESLSAAHASELLRRWKQSLNGWRAACRSAKRSISIATAGSQDT